MTYIDFCKMIDDVMKTASNNSGKIDMNILVTKLGDMRKELSSIGSVNEHSFDSWIGQYLPSRGLNLSKEAKKSIKIQQTETNISKFSITINDAETDGVAYLVDTENVGNIWFELIPNMTNNDIIYVFYTGDNIHCTYKQLNLLVGDRCPKIRFIECLAGSNALDFQLSVYLGNIIGSHLYKKVCILSNDNGYKFSIHAAEQILE